MENNEEIIMCTKGKMQKIAQKVQDELPEGFGFIVLTFKFNEKGQMIYISNANREDVVEAMKEFIKKTEQNYGNDTEKY